MFAGDVRPAYPEKIASAAYLPLFHLLKAVLRGGVAVGVVQKRPHVLYAPTDVPQELLGRLAAIVAKQVLLGK